MAEIPYSKSYLHDLKELYTQHEDGQISDETLSQRSDELREKEAKLHESLGHTLLMQKLGDAEKEIADQAKIVAQQKKEDVAALEHAQKAEEAFQMQQKLRAQHDAERKAYQLKANDERKAREQQDKIEFDRSDFRNDIRKYTNNLENSTKTWQFGYTWLQIILLFFSAITATMAGIDGVPRWIVAISGVIATIAGSLLTTFKIQDRIYAIRKAEADVRLECQMYDHQIGDYAGLSSEQAFLRFSKQITSVQGQQMLQEVEFWNPKHEAENKEAKAVKDDIKEDHQLDEMSEKPSEDDNALPIVPEGKNDEPL